MEERCSLLCRMSRKMSAGFLSAFQAVLRRNSRMWWLEAQLDKISLNTHNFLEICPCNCQMTYSQRGNTDCWYLFFCKADLIQYLGKFCVLEVLRTGLHSCVAFPPSCCVTLGPPVLTLYDPFVDYGEQDSKPVIHLTACH